ncbi:MAG: metalloregulator ArsR/SmtB family transcription factor [Desulfomonile sp.]|nr:metalloregulator ArsR/SmtB family transcription factor [Desulfomonile sp.]
MKAEVFKAMGQSTRLGIIEILQAGEMQVSQIAAHLRTDASNVSKHLSLLRKYGIVADRKAGINIFYRTTIPELMKFLGCVDRAVLQRIGNQSAANPVSSRVSGTSCS